MRIKKGEVQVFSISFLDVLSCALGAVIILLVVVPKSPPKPEAESNIIQTLQSLVQSLTKENHSLSRKTKQLQEKESTLEEKVNSLIAENIKLKEKPAPKPIPKPKPKPIPKPKKSPKPSLFGLPLKAGHAVFIIDVSASMDWQVQNLYNTIESLLLSCEVDKYRFIYFDELVYSSGLYWKHGWLEGTTVNKEITLREINETLNDLISLEPYSTNSGDALGQALRFKDTDVIYFITDGYPTSGETNVERILLRVRRMNTQNAIINSIMVGLPGAGRNIPGGPIVFDKNAQPKALYDFLHDLADQNGGVYVGR